MKRNIEDLAGGIVLAAAGLFVAIYVAAHYDIGSLRRMGPGFFPILLGASLAILGVVIAIPAWSQARQPMRIAWKEAAAVLSAIVVFALGLERAGLIPSTAAAVLIASLAAPDRRILWRLVLAVAVTVLSVAVFHFGLRMTVPLWPGRS